MTEHRVGFVQLAHASLDHGGLHAHEVGHFLLALVVVRQEFVQRRIEQANRDRQALHRGEDAHEVFALERQQLRERGLASFVVGRKDHLAHRLNAIAFEEHVLGAAEADAFGAKVASPLGVGRRVGVGANLQRAILVGPLHDLGEVAAQLGFLGVDRADHDFAGRAVERDRVLARERLAIRR